jgi:NADH/NAD ratio-sensing transcriptional regulator Rex
VKAVWNFTPTTLQVPPGVLVRNEHISIGLCEIAYHLKQQGITQAAGERDPGPVTQPQG